MGGHMRVKFLFRLDELPFINFYYTRNCRSVTRIS